MARRKPPKITANAPIWGICRKSEEDDQRQVESIPDQIKQIKEHYEEHFPANIRAAHRLRFIETAQSGFVPGLPTVAEVCKAAARGEVYGVLASRVNRLGRNHEDLGKFTQCLADGLIPFLGTTDGKRFKGEDIGTIIMLGLEGAMGWHESAEKSRVVFDRMRIRAKEGKHMARKMFGFKPHHVVMENGEVMRHTVKDEERFLHLVTMYRMAAAGTSFPDIARWAKRKKIKQRNGQSLGTSTIAGIIHNPYPKGATRYAGVVYENTHEAFVSPELWQAAQEGVARRSHTSGRKKKQDLRKLFVFGDTVHCAKCKGVMSPYRVVKKKTGSTFIYYECKNRRTNCKQILRQEALQSQFNAILEKTSCNEGLLTQIREKLVSLHKEKSVYRQQEVRHLQKEYMEIDAALSKQVLALARADELGVGHVIEAEIKQLKTQLEATKAKMDEVHDEGMGWIDKVIGSFKLIELAKEAIFYGSPVVREAVIKALCSNLSVNDKKLILEPRSPFKEALQQEGSKLWWTISDSNRGPFECESNALTS